MADVDGFLDRISQLVSELHGRLQDDSLLNADLSAYSSRLDAAIVNLRRVYPYLRNTNAFDSIIFWMCVLQNALISVHPSSSETFYTPPRVYTGKLNCRLAICML